MTLTLELRRILPAPPAAVFAAFTEPDQLARWWGPEGFTIGHVEFRPRAGATYRIEMQPPDGDAFWLTGTVREADPPELLAYTFAWEDPDPDDVENLVSLRFRDHDGSTEVGFSQAPFETEARRALHHDGWTDSLDKLERLLAGQASVNAQPE